MNIKALIAFRKTLNEGSIVKAAEKMHLSQSAVSRLVSSLEGELKLQLFYREGRSLKPTEEAIAFYREAGRILENLDEIKQIATEIRETQIERLRILTMPRVGPTLVAPAISQFASQVPNVRLKLDVRTRRDAQHWLLGREYDIGIGALPLDNTEIKTEVLIKARAQAVLPKDHPLAKKTEITAEDLVDENIIALIPGLLLRTQMDDFFSSAGIAKTFQIEAASSQIACQLVAEGTGICFADSLTAGIVNQDDIILRPLIPERWMSFGVLYPKKNVLTPNGLRFIQSLKTQAQQLAQASTYVSVED